jgi:lysophospholipase L1-like esterase
MRFHIAITSMILLLAGCGAMKQTSPMRANSVGVGAKYQRDLADYPKVVFIGDDITANWFPQSAIWINKGISGQTSGQVLARFQTDVIDLHPDIVNILVGTYDVATYPAFWDPVCGPATGAYATCENVAAMIAMAQAANIKVMVGTLPPFGPGPLATKLAGGNPANVGTLSGTIGLYDRNLGLLAGFELGGFTPDKVVLVDYAAALAAIGQWTDNGVDPNAAGYQAMTELAQEEISSLKAGS